MSPLPAPLRFLALASACQLLGFGLAVGISQTTTNFPIGIMVMLHSVIALIAARFLKLPAIWQIFSFSIAPLMVLTSDFSVPSWLLFSIGLIVTMLFLPTFWTRVPYYPTTPLAFHLVSERLPRGRPIQFIDLGSGFAGLLVHLARAHPQSTFIGFEISPLAFIISTLRLLPYRNAQIRFRSFWGHSLSTYDVVYAFLSPQPMAELWAKVQAEAKSGALFISNTFPAPANSNEEVPLTDGHHAQKLYLYRR